MPEHAPVIATLATQHGHFLDFVTRRLGGDRAAAEDLLQDAFVRSLERADALRAPESARAWFFRSLRNAVIDRHRRLGAQHRALAAFAAELEGDGAPAAWAEICRCIGALATTLKPAYAEAIQQVEVEGQPVHAYADAAGISRSNAGVRLFRAREALRAQVRAACGTCAEHGCQDCHCAEGRR